MLLYYVRKVFSGDWKCGLPRNNELIHSRGHKQRRACGLTLNGGADGDRTHDLMNAIHALSQLSYSPTEKKSNMEKERMSKWLVPEVGIEPTWGGSPAGF